MNKFAAALPALMLLAVAFAPAWADTNAPAEVAPDGTRTILAEGFEGTWPTAGWTLTDISGDGYQRLWGKDDFKPYAGSYSVWPAAAGTHAVDPATGVYPDNLNARMVYGPFDLSDALSAQLTFYLWAEIESSFGDWLWVGTSGNNSIYAEVSTWEGTLEWDKVVVDLSQYAGDNSVWVRWDFVSDDEVGMAGAFIDDIVITANTLDKPVVTLNKNGSNMALTWPAVANATSYEVWRAANAPYFTPGADCAGNPSACTVTTLTSYIHADGGGSTANNYTYVVRAVRGAVKSQPSARVGEFDFGLVR